MSNRSCYSKSSSKKKTSTRNTKCANLYSPHELEYYSKNYVGVVDIHICTRKKEVKIKIILFNVNVVHELVYL